MMVTVKGSKMQRLPLVDKEGTRYGTFFAAEGTILLNLSKPVPDVVYTQVIPDKTNVHS
jgi:hypothetical protein